MARWKKEKTKERSERHYYSVPLRPLKDDPDADWERDGPTCDWCGIKAREVDGDSDWLIGAGVHENGTLAIARYCAPCFQEKIEWGRVYCPGGFGTLVFPVGIE